MVKERKFTLRFDEIYTILVKRYSFQTKLNPKDLSAAH